jgi:glycosyltransferase involved in cell wall biosynthesis
MIPVYNRTTYLERTLRGVLSQDPGPEEMQIEVVDDASTEGDVEALVRRVGGERVKFSRHPCNLGLAGAWNSCIEESVGEWVHILHSDDIVFPGFYARLRAGLEKMNDVGAAFCRHMCVDEDERQLSVSELESSTPVILPAFIEKIGARQRIVCASIVVKRSVYENLGGFRKDLSVYLDWEMWIRIAAQYPFWYEPATLAAYRLHSRSVTHDVITSGEATADVRRFVAISYRSLPPDRAEDISRRLREMVAIHAFEYALTCGARLALPGAVKHAWHGLRCSHSPRVMKALLLLPARIVRGGMRRAYAAAKRPRARE